MASHSLSTDTVHSGAGGCDQCSVTALQLSLPPLLSPQQPLLFAPMVGYFLDYHTNGRTQCGAFPVWLLHLIIAI